MVSTSIVMPRCRLTSVLPGLFALLFLVNLISPSSHHQMFHGKLHRRLLRWRLKRPLVMTQNVCGFCVVRVQTTLQKQVLVGILTRPQSASHGRATYDLGLVEIGA